jgi:hypothetical protein
MSVRPFAVRVMGLQDFAAAPIRTSTMTHRLLASPLGRKLAWFLADHGIMREKVEEAFKHRLRSAAPVASTK